MNERIKEIDHKAWWLAMEEWRSLPESNNGKEVDIHRVTRFKEYFAELIIQECAIVQHKRFCEHGDVSWDILMEHFGVK